MLTLNITRHNRDRLRTGDVVVLHAPADVENGPHPDDLLDRTPPRLATVLDVRYHPNNAEFLTDIDVREHDAHISTDDRDVTLSTFSSRTGRSLGEIHRLVLSDRDDTRITGSDTVALLCDACGRNITTDEQIRDHAGRDLCATCASDAHTHDDPDAFDEDRDIAIMEAAQREQAVAIADARVGQRERELRVATETYRRGHATLDRVHACRRALADAQLAEANAVRAHAQDREGEQRAAMIATADQIHAIAIRTLASMSPHDEVARARLAMSRLLLGSVPATSNVMHALCLIDAELPDAGTPARRDAFDRAHRWMREADLVNVVDMTDVEQTSEAIG